MVWWYPYALINVKPEGGGRGWVMHRVGILTFSKKNYQNPHPLSHHSQSLHAIETGISSGLMGHLACMQTLPIHLEEMLGGRRVGGYFSYSSGTVSQRLVVCEKQNSPFYFQSEHVKSPYRSTYVSFKAFSENWDVHQNKIPQLMTFFILVTSLLANE